MGRLADIENYLDAEITYQTKRMEDCKGTRNLEQRAEIMGRLGVCKEINHILEGGD